jgi:ribosomal protein L37E
MMFCPNCGKANSTDQKFCRSCGFNLAETTRSVVQQRPAGESGYHLNTRKELVEKMLLSILGVGLAGGVAILIWGIITSIILDKGQLLGGLLGIALVLAAAVTLVLVVYRQVLIDKAAKVRYPHPSFLFPNQRPDSWENRPLNRSLPSPNRLPIFWYENQQRER